MARSRKAPMKQIIFLNGPSSSGKTTLAKALQQASEHPFLHIGIDKMISMMPEKLNNWTGGIVQEGFWWKKTTDAEGHLIQEIQVGPFGEKIWEALIETVVVLAKLGHFIIVDEVASGKGQIDRWRESLRAFDILWIGVTAPITVLEERERARGNRMLGCARAQLAKVHEGVDYDRMVDTSSQSIVELVALILREQRCD